MEANVKSNGIKLKEMKEELEKNKMNIVGLWLN